RRGHEGGTKDAVAVNGVVEDMKRHIVLREPRRLKLECDRDIQPVMQKHWCDGLVGSTTSRWAFLILAPRSYWTVLPKLREQRIDVLERHAAPSLEKSRSISVSPETNQSFVSGMPHIPRNSSRTRSNSLGACCTNPKVRAGDLKLKTFLLLPMPPAIHRYRSSNSLSLNRFGGFPVFG